MGIGLGGFSIILALFAVAVIRAVPPPTAEQLAKFQNDQKVRKAANERRKADALVAKREKDEQAKIAKGETEERDRLAKEKKRKEKEENDLHEMVLRQTRELSERESTLEKEQREKEQKQVSAKVSRNEVTITRAEYGDAWRFTVKSGVLSGKMTDKQLSNGTKLPEVTFRVGAVTYAVNGTAQGSKRYVDIDRIWARDPKFSAASAIKKDIGPIIYRGLKLAEGIDVPFVAQ